MWLYLRDQTIFVLVVYAPRHEDEYASIALQKLDACVVLRINHGSLDLMKQYSDLCMCFGPAWIFSDKIINCLTKIFLITMEFLCPLSWWCSFYSKFLISHVEVGHLFNITSDVDRGSVVACEEYHLTEACVTPFDYQHYK